jgi:hypothetical protein
MKSQVTQPRSHLQRMQSHLNAAKAELNETNETEMRYVAMGLVWALEELAAAVRDLQAHAVS